MFLKNKAKDYFIYFTYLPLAILAVQWGGEMYLFMGKLWQTFQTNITKLICSQSLANQFPTTVLQA